MHIRVQDNTVTIEGYVNAVERNSKPLHSRLGRFIERIRKGAFKRAIEKNEDIHILLNHDWSRDLGSTKAGNLTLKEDSIGLHARAEINDAEVAEDARKGNLVGWSFGFRDVEGGVERKTEDGMMVRVVSDMDMREVSIINRAKSPAYEGTLIMVRAEDDAELFGEIFESDIELEDIPTEERSEESAKQDDPDADIIDYSRYDELIAEMKGDKAE